MMNLLRNLLKLLTGVLTPLGAAVACLVAVAATIECPRILPFILLVAGILILCMAKEGGK